MNSKVDVIAASSERLPYPQDRSRYFGSVKKETLRLVFSFYSPDGNEIAMPIASMSAYLKQEFPWVEVLLEPVLILRVLSNTLRKITRRPLKHWTRI